MGKFAGSPAVLLLAFGVAGTAHTQAVPGQCGYDRWPVNTLTDKDSNRVDFHPLQTTAARLAAIPIHEIPHLDDSRTAPEEFHVYRVPARLIQARREQDEDLHVVIADIDHPGIGMIAEIPAPARTSGPGHEEKYRGAGAIVRAVQNGAEIAITGVGFFDFTHDQKGGARNGIELHPVLGTRSIEAKGSTGDTH